MKINSLNIGCRFTPDHVEVIEKLVAYQRKEGYRNKITGVYGSPPNINWYGSTRPIVREGVATYGGDNYRDAITRLKKIGLFIRTTLNSPLTYIRKENPREKNIFYSPDGVNKENMKTFAYFISCMFDESDSFIVANPMLVQVMHENPIFDFVDDITISTIMNVRSVPQMEWIADHWPKVKMVCPALWIGRDLELLKRMNKVIPLELLANEFCSLGGVECEGIFRQCCYLHQSLDLPDANPMRICMAERDKRPWSWMMAKFILPQWMGEVYNKQTGISTFKITGRTHSAEYIEFIGKTYIEGDFEGNLLSLWGHLQATLDQENWKDKQEEAISRSYVHTAIVRFLPSQMVAGSCNSQICGNPCSLCKKLYLKEVDKNDDA